MIQVDGRQFSESHPLIVGEVAQAHDGSLGTAHAFIDAIANAGADAVKFQTHIAEAESSVHEPWRVKFSFQDNTRFDYWKRMEFSEAQWRGLAEHARERGLVFLSSPFSGEAVELLRRVGVSAWKIASGEVGNQSIFERIVDSGLPVFLSTGMSPLDEVDASVSLIRQHAVPLTVFQCTSAYPCPPEKVGLNVLSYFRDRYGCSVGLSDHSGTIYPALAATALGVEAIEVHVTLSREMFGPDVSSSVTTLEMKQLVEGVRFIEKMMVCPVDKNRLAADLLPLRQAFMKSIVARVDLEAGTILRMEHLALKKPGTGMAPERLKSLIGLKLLRRIAKDSMLAEEDLEETSIT